MRLLLSVLGVFTAVVCIEKPAEAEQKNYPWCINKPDESPQCRYATFEQCLADRLGKGIAPRHDAEAVVLDLMQPIRPRWRPFGGQWQAGFDVAAGMGTQRHRQGPEG